MKKENILIAEFMGKYCSKSIQPIKPKVHEYHKDWNLLMSVIEKIEAEWTEDGLFEFRIHADRTVIVSSQDFYELLHQDGGNKLENTYGAVIQFIEHYNFNLKNK